MFILSCYQTTTILPNPDLDDNENLLYEIDIKRNLGGTKHYYVKLKKSRQKLTFNFTLTRMKALELREFIRAYMDRQIRIRYSGWATMLGCWKGYLTMNPFTFTSINADVIKVPLEFEGVECDP